MRRHALTFFALTCLMGTFSRAIVSESVNPGAVALSMDLSAAKVYPNPWRADKHTGNELITFDSLPDMATVQIFTVSGAFVKALSESNHQALWDLTNDSGRKVASGIYLYVMATDDGQEHRGKLAVIK